MDRGDSLHYSSAKIKMIASAVKEKNMFRNLHLYENLTLGRLRNNLIVILHQQRR